MSTYDPSRPGMPPLGLPKTKAGCIPWVAGCGGCLVLVVLALFALGLLGYFTERAEREAGLSADSVAGEPQAGSDSGGEAKTLGVATATYSSVRQGLNPTLEAS
ncbi:MAG TPA: hypothetical protein VEW03_11095, partial [Longimicrobiaceae bacterium]|nr:hypothetical protein [Longimicrobiaceae bacterium]